MVEPNGEHYLKPYGAKGTLAFRQDTVLSRVSVMHGSDEEKTNYPLAPGRTLPAISTDTAVKGGIYFYGSLGMCPSEGQGKWTPHTKQKELQAVLSAGIITIIEVTNVCAGPSACSDAQWSKSGSSPECARVVGCIITESLAECFFDARPKTPEHSHIVIKEFGNIVKNPHKYLHPKCLAFMHRYLAGGCFAAYGHWVPRRCVWLKNLEAKQEETDVVNAILKECVSPFFRDDSWSDPNLSEAKIALQTWIREGLPPKNGKLYLDPVLNDEYSQMDLS